MNMHFKHIINHHPIYTYCAILVTHFKLHCHKTNKLQNTQRRQTKQQQQQRDILPVSQSVIQSVSQSVSHSVSLCQPSGKEGLTNEIRKSWQIQHAVVFMFM